MKIFRVLTAIVLFYTTCLVKSEKNVFKNAQDQMQWLQFEAYWEAYYSGKIVIGEDTFAKILEDRNEKNMPSFSSLHVNKKLTEFEKIIRTFKSVEGGPSPSQLAELEQIQDSYAFFAYRIILSRGNETFNENIYFDYPKDLSALKDNSQDKNLTYSELLDNYLDEGPLSSYDSIKILPSLKLATRRSLFGIEFDVLGNEKAGKILDAAKLLLNIHTFPKGLKILESMLPYTLVDLLRKLGLDPKGRHEIAVHLAKRVVVDEDEDDIEKESTGFLGAIFGVWKRIGSMTAFIENTVFDSVLNVEKVYNETLKDAKYAEYTFCELNTNSKENWSRLEKSTMAKAMKFTTAYFAAKVSLEVENVQFSKLYDAIIHGHDKGDCSRYPALARNPKVDKPPNYIVCQPSGVCFYLKPFSK